MQTMKRAVFFFLSAALFALCARAEVLPSKVYVVANSDDPDSLAIADFYASARGIPKGNIVGLPMPKAGKISKAEYFEKIENPLVAELAKRGALKAVKLGGREPSGREIYSYVSHDIGFLVLCRGVPWGVNPSPNSPAPNPPKSFSDAASVDSELSDRFVSSKKLAGFLKNPLFNNYSWGMTPSIAGVIPVARLDGAARADAEGLVKSAIEAEKRGIAGRVYIDKSKREKTGDRWLDAAAKILSAAGFDVSENSEPAALRLRGQNGRAGVLLRIVHFPPVRIFRREGIFFPARGERAAHIFVQRLRHAKRRQLDSGVRFQRRGGGFRERLRAVPRRHAPSARLRSRPRARNVLGRSSDCRDAVFELAGRLRGRPAFQTVQNRS